MSFNIASSVTEQDRQVQGRQGQRGNGQSESGSFADEFSAAILQDYDADGDGKISLEESGLDEKFFNMVDKDGDGFHSQEEIGDHVQSVMEQFATWTETGFPTDVNGNSLAEEFAASVIGERDKDGDGFISQEESGLEQDYFDLVDKDGDGKHSAEEIADRVHYEFNQLMAEWGRANGMQARDFGSTMAGALNIDERSLA